jgi:hypothetical protein
VGYTAAMGYVLEIDIVFIHYNNTSFIRKRQWYGDII